MYKKTQAHWLANALFIELGPSVYPPIQVVIDKHPVRFFVHKRPHVDFFLEVVSANFPVMIFFLIVKW